MDQVQNLKIKGLWTNPNSFSAVPEGALLHADNLVIDRNDIASSRRGQTYYLTQLVDNGTDPQPAGPPKNIFDYGNDRIVYYSDLLAYDDGTTWNIYDGTYNPPDTIVGMRSAQSNKNFYFTTTQGIEKLDAINGTPYESGVPRALNGVGIIDGTTGFFPDQTNVAYRIVWGYKDANQNLILGAPSSRIIVSNNSGNPTNVELTFQIPDSYRDGWFYQIYRSATTVDLNTEPDDELQLVDEDTPTSGEVTAGFVTTIDDLPSSLRGAALYTNPNQQGILQSNDQPPLAVDLTSYRNCLFFGNTTAKNQLFITLVSVGNPDGIFAATDSGTAVNGSATITGLSDTSGWRVGMRVKGTDIPDNAKILSVDSTSQITMTVNSTGSSTSESIEVGDVITLDSIEYYATTGTNDPAAHEFFADDGGSPAENIYNTSNNFIQVVNENPDNTTLYGYYNSGENDAPGRMFFEERDIGGPQFTITSNAGNSFNPKIPASGSNTSNTSDNQAKPHRIYFSKPLQPEAVPGVNYVEAGSEKEPIRRIIALRDSVFIFKDDGVFRITGDSPNNFTVTLFDQTINIKAPKAAVAFNSQIYLYSTSGIIQISEGGGSVIKSWPIQTDIINLQNPQFVNFETASFGVSYQSDNKYMFFTVTEEDDEYATQAFIYNSVTDTWTKWIMTRSCGRVSQGDNTLYMGNPLNNYIYKERKSFTELDYADEDFEVTITGFDGFEIELTSTTGIQVGMTIVQGFISAIIEEVVDGTTIIVNEDFDWTVGPATIYTPILNFLEWAEFAAGNPGVVKQFQRIALLFIDAAFIDVNVGFYTDFSLNTETVTIPSRSSSSWGNFAWDSEPWGGVLGGKQVLTTIVPLLKQRAHWLSLNVTNQQAFTSFSLGGAELWVNPVNNRFN